MTSPARRPGDVWAGVLATWCAVCVVLGAWTGFELWQLSDLGATVADSGLALDAAGAGLESLGAVPVVGDATAELGEQVRANASDIVAGAGQAQRATRRLAVLVGLAVAITPSLPAVALLVAVRRGLLGRDGG